MQNSKLILVDYLIWFILFIFFFIFTLIAGPIFVSVRNIKFILLGAIPIAYLAIGEGICLLSGNFDLSVGQMTGFIAVASGLMMTEWFPNLSWYGGVIFAIFCGIIFGAFNGFFVSKLRLSPFLVTLSTYLMIMGFKQMLTLKTITGIPPEFLAIGGGYLGVVPLSFIVFILFLLIVFFIIEVKPLGIRIRAIGSDRDAARMLGINVVNNTLLVFILSGIFCALSAIAYMGYIGCVTSHIADGDVFFAIAAPVLGGISIRGGRGKILGALGGILCLSVIRTGLVMMYVDPRTILAIQGLLILIAIVIDTFRNRLRDSLLRL